MHYGGGSPPRAWGRLPREDGELVARRFTPTCVGTAAASVSVALVVPVHPHVRGDGFPSPSRSPHLSGSPPRAWGRRGKAAGLAFGVRFTPTCVGTATPVRLSRRAMYGSPPRAWGRRTAVGAVRAGQRFTPTCVGTAWGQPLIRFDTTVHPHVRGDGASSYGAVLCLTGSPPRAWGRPMADMRHRWPGRFTPTCVGTAVERETMDMITTVHPHVRGDGVRLMLSSRIAVGSPPRAWGRPGQQYNVTLLDRFTPTCVGTALRPTAKTQRRTVHPHVRGDG